MRNKIIVISIFFLSFSILVRAQDTQILDKDMFDIALDSLIEIKFYEVWSYRRDADFCMLRRLVPAILTETLRFRLPRHIAS